jgi:hypothetical protein
MYKISFFIYQIQLNISVCNRYNNAGLAFFNIQIIKLNKTVFSINFCYLYPKAIFRGWWRKNLYWQVVSGSF